jgi:D-threonate/D-erythronate kinase
MSGLYLVADDLTGALDSAAAFCGCFGAIPVYLGTPHPNDDVHATVDLATRDADAPPHGMVDAQVVDRLARAAIAFQKVDSRLRGYWPIELAGLMKNGAFDVCVMAPAFPAQGRTTIDGRQIIDAVGASDTSLSIDLVGALHAHGLRVQRIDRSGPSSNVPFAIEDIDVVLCDASTDEDLQSIVRWVHRQPAHDRRLLWCGSAGLARALARADPPRAPSLRRPALIVIGSMHAATRAQLAYAVATGTPHEIVKSDDFDATAMRIRSAFEANAAVILTFAFADGTAERAAALAIAARLQALLPSIARPQGLVVSGGQTLLALCRAVDATSLTVDSEQSPGVPHATLRGGRWDGVEVWSKSGGFGRASWLADLLARARPCIR